MSQGIEGKVVVITGASSGLGEAVARRLHAGGARLILGARRLDRLQALAHELGLADDAVVRTDVTDAGQVRTLVDRAVALHGRLDVLINNAGLMPNAPLERARIEDWDRMIDVNIKGVLYGIAAAIPLMTAARSGHIINVASVAGHRVRPGSAVYSATKTAVRVLSEGLRQEMCPYGVRVTIISPGAVQSELPDTITDPATVERVRAVYANAVSPDSFARAVQYAMEQPDDVSINEVLFRPTVQDY